MPSPFPGMDPLIEGQVWEDFHTHFITDLFSALVPRLCPRYVVRVERRVYVEHDLDGRTDFIRPNVSVLEREGGDAFSESAAVE